MLIRLLLALEDPGLRRRAARLAAQPNVLLYAVDDVEGMWEALTQDSADLVLMARESLPGSPTDLVRSLQKLPDAPDLILFQPHEQAEDRMALLAAGCFAVLSRDQPDEVLAAALATLVRRRRESSIARLQAGHASERYQLADFASVSPAMDEVLRLARRVAQSDSSLLILGETGVGKEWLARAIHAEGTRARAPFIAINMAAIQESLLESELFGHEKGAFTGAITPRRGHFELAHRGTLFLDEIGDMPAHLQARLLRVLQERKIQRLGSEQLIEVDVRVMAATNRDLAEAMATQDFRRDLYYRLSVVSLTLPPLRERREDIASLVESYRERFCQLLGRQVTAVSEAAMAALAAYSWPGNVRELINVMERAVLLAEGETLSLGDLPESIALRATAEAGTISTPALPLPPGWTSMPLKELREEVVRELERAYLGSHLRATKGKVGETAARAGLVPRSLYEKMRILDLRKEDYRT